MEDPTQYRKNRIAFVEEWKRSDSSYCDFQVSMSLDEFGRSFSSLGSGERGTSVISVAGRVKSLRASGRKLRFYGLETAQGDLQAVASFADFRHGSVESFVALHSAVKRGDIIGATGTPGRTKHGELSIFVTDLLLLAPCLHMLPKSGRTKEEEESWTPGKPRNLNSYVLRDQETRYRRRYLDVIANAQIKSVFLARASALRYLRQFLHSRGFLEVETAVLNTKAGGAAAKPFVTHHHGSNSDMVLRIAPELQLKPLLVAGYRGIFEIGKQFRNEGIDLTHNPEFTTCEFYKAYADYNDLMQMTEELLSGMVKDITGGYKILYHSDGLENPPVTIDFTPPFRRIHMLEELKTVMGVEFPDDLASAEANSFLRASCEARGIECSPPRTTTRLLDKLVGHYLEATCVNPTFIIDHPLIMSPLAKRHRSKPGLTERFELFVNKHELVNAYTELNDPVDQRERFYEQLKDRQVGDEEAMVADEDFITALEYGLPPCAGWGMGIDRLAMLLTDSLNIKEVLLSPAMKPDGIKKPVEDGASVTAIAPEPQNEEETFLLVRTRQGLEHSVKADMKSTVRALKLSLVRLSGLSVDQQRLLSRGKALDNERSLESYGLTNRSVLHLVRATMDLSLINMVVSRSRLVTAVRKVLNDRGLMDFDEYQVLSQRGQLQLVAYPSAVEAAQLVGSSVFQFTPDSCNAYLMGISFDEMLDIVEEIIVEAVARGVPISRPFYRCVRSEEAEENSSGMPHFVVDANSFQIYLGGHEVGSGWEDDGSGSICMQLDALLKVVLGGHIGNPKEFYEDRLSFVNGWRGTDSAYPHKFEVSMDFAELHNQFGDLQSGQQLLEPVISVAGRVMTKRDSQKLLLESADGSVVAAVHDACSNLDFAAVKRGDVVGLTGLPGKTERGELCIFVTDLRLLAPCLHLIPKNEALDQETRYRCRYLDIILNSRAKSVVFTRDAAFRYIRDFLHVLGFTEVETAVLNKSFVKRAARPFVTHHNELDMDMFMRVSSALQLKLMIVAGYGGVYEIGKQFRNESADSTHNPELTTCEFYKAYANYNDLMKISEDLISGLVRSITGGTKVCLPNGRAIDFTPPFRRVDVIDGLQAALHLELPQDLRSEEANTFLRSICDEHGVQCPSTTTTVLLEALAERFLGGTCETPTFILDHPLMSMTKKHRTKAGRGESFQLFVNKVQLVTGQADLNDPLEQRERLLMAHEEVDEDLITALEHGLPPCAGWSLEMDRLVMLLTGFDNVKEALLY